MSHSELSEGAVQLSRAASVRATAKRLGVSTRTVSSWRSGESLPSLASQAAIAQAYPQVQQRFWSIKAGFAGLAQAAEAPAPVALAEAPSSPDKEPTAVERLKAQLARLDAQRAEPGLTAKARIDLEAISLKCSAALARHTGLALTRAQVLESPYLQELADASIAALEADWLGMCLAIDGLMGLDGEASKVAQCARDFPAEYAGCLAANAAMTAALTQWRESRKAVA